MATDVSLKICGGSPIEFMGLKEVKFYKYASFTMTSLNQNR